MDRPKCLHAYSEYCPACLQGEVDRLRASLAAREEALATALGERVLIISLKRALKTWAPNQSGEVLYALGLVHDDALSPPTPAEGSA
jgi:hypothetical protein